MRTEPHRRACTTTYPRERQHDMTRRQTDTEPKRISRLRSLPAFVRGLSLRCCPVSPRPPALRRAFQALRRAFRALQVLAEMQPLPLAWVSLESAPTAYQPRRLPSTRRRTRRASTRRPTLPARSLSSWSPPCRLAGGVQEPRITGEVDPGSGNYTDTLPLAAPVPPQGSKPAIQHPPPSCQSTVNSPLPRDSRYSFNAYRTTSAFFTRDVLIPACFALTLSM